MELKTLKDLTKLHLDCEHNPHVDLYELKQESIKWIRKRVYACIDCNEISRGLRGLCEEHKFWAERFNITNEDFKMEIQEEQELINDYNEAIEDSNEYGV